MRFGVPEISALKSPVGWTSSTPPGEEEPVAFAREGDATVDVSEA
jgi:hypothetical protein